MKESVDYLYGGRIKMTRALCGTCTEVKLSGRLPVCFRNAKFLPSTRSVFVQTSSEMVASTQHRPKYAYTIIIQDELFSEAEQKIL